MANYYDQILKKIKELVEKNNLTKALDIINQELEISYIPSDFEKSLYKIKREIKEKQCRQLNKTYSISEIKALLNSKNNLDQIVGIKNLININIRLIIDEIKKYLLNTNNVYENKSLLLISLSDQQIDQEFEVFKDKKNSFLVNPKLLNIKEIYNTYYQVENQILEIINQKDIFLIQTCKQVLFSYFLYKFPYVESLIENDVIIAIIYISYQLNNLEFDTKRLNKSIEFSKASVDKIIIDIKRSGVFGYES
ncbi:DUF3196 domain-containing protein [Mycoplasma capricolum subsp. capripneumoniae]|uniref:Uncharacterized protein n=1 Tax=Mycoplasma capricolum subsp. capripneumoniae 87001 TaxID=1124992 RepID=A0A9N7BPS2_MYCCC|nr:DUF3196 family protein [Mycoplasma capricolum]AJK51576.1 hypothetical protein MCCG_0624 [Mycoplasma capricolum subsp. capripneumoniae 87001]KEY84608.1 hypothetical protein DUF3196 family [Mycoplasma capricolum subsp. capripneumoniae 99108]QDL19693.1 DUF3196 domain-containing protein [Mycoplasma capricolum subsp. capripneumoniae]QDL20378.1 DUF3196 domain-containing protein [Mycoplasma capricolum subsp. capripneumoniae]QDL21065.1 DUF3196 domain-containing protein [Mycoplasma capricolum subsp.